MFPIIKKYPVTLALASAIICACLLPIPDVPAAANVPLFDKWTHMLMYAGLCTALWTEYWRCHQHASVSHHLRQRAGHLMLTAMLEPLTLSGMLELLQAYGTTYRSGEWLDFAANAIGVALGTIVGIVLGRIVRPKK